MESCTPYPPLVEKFILAQQQFEDWVLPGQVDRAGVLHPNGSLSYQNNNPCNIRFSKWQLKPIPEGLGALGPAVGNNFSKFSTYHDGFNAGCEFLSDVIKNELIPYRNRASVLGLKNSGELSILEYIKTYAPAGDNNYPVHYASFIANSLGVTVETPINTLIV